MKTLKTTAPQIKVPYLIQRCKAREFNSSMKSGEFLKLDYMGAAEFEFGALPQWQREMHSKLDRLVVGMVEHNGTVLYVMTEAQQLDEYSQMIKDLIDGKVQLKEGIGLNTREVRWVGKRKDKPIFDDPGMPFEFDTWWDLTNSLAFARSPDTLLQLKQTIANSVTFMDQQKKAV